MLISKLGDVAWPPRSSDLIVPYFYLLGYLKGLVYRGSPMNIKKLKRLIRREKKDISTDVLKRLFLHLPSRMEECIKVNGFHLRNVISKR